LPRRAANHLKFIGTEDYLYQTLLVIDDTAINVS